jgi:hypothetical protein
MPDQKWFDEQPMEQLEAIFAGSSDKHLKTMAGVAIQKLKDKKLKEDSDRKEDVRQKLETQKIEREDSRFQIQFDETRRQNCWTRCLSVGALLVSVGSLVVAICALSSRKTQSPQPELPIPQPAPTVFLPVTNATPSNPPLPTVTPKP